MPSLFNSFFMGGFESSCHRLNTGRRLDVIAATAHDRFVRQDYQRLVDSGIRAARDGIRWHLVEPSPGRYDFSSFLPMLRAAHETGVQVVWDLCHYGWPDDIDIFSAAFVDRFARLAGAVTRLVANEQEEPAFFSPMNEISFWAWGGGDVGYLNPFGLGRGNELKHQLVRAAIAAIEAVWDVDPGVRIVHTDPVINVIADPDRPQDRKKAEHARLAQYEAFDMLAGRMKPSLGGRPEYLDILGLNYYYNNQWIFGGRHITDRTDPLYRPLRSLLQEVYARYNRPLFIAETGIEFEGRPDWLRYVGQEVRGALAAGVPLEGVCLYPIVNYPGWDDDRHCQNGLWDYADENGEREVYQPLAEELERQRSCMEEILVP